MSPPPPRTPPPPLRVICDGRVVGYCDTKFRPTDKTGRPIGAQA